MNTRRKGWITTVFLAMILAVTVSPARGGIIFGGITSDGPNACVDTETATDMSVSGILNSITGIIFGLTANDPEPVDCGIIFTERK